MSVQIRLSHCDYTVTLPKEGLRAMRGSLLAQALEDDPEAKEIVLDNPVIQPYHIYVIGMMARYEKLEVKNELVGPFDAAAQYLNWPLLEVVASLDAYAQMQVFAPYVNIYKPETYGPLLLWSIKTGFTSLAQHILQVTEPGPLDGQALTLSVMMGNLETVQKLLQRGVDPVMNYTPKYVLDIWYPQKMFVYDLFHDDYWPRKVDALLETTIHQTFYLACLKHIQQKEMNVLRYLLRDERIRQMTPLKQIIQDDIIWEENLVEIITSTDIGKEFSLNEALQLLLRFVTPYNSKSVYIVAQNPHLPLPKALRQQILPDNYYGGKDVEALIKSFLP